MTEMLNIGYVIGALNTGGSERQLSELALGMAMRGHVVQVVCYDGAGSQDSVLENQGITVRHMPGGRKIDKVKNVKEWMNEFKPDITHGFMKRASSIAILANLPSKNSKIIASDLSTATFSRRKPILWGALVLFAFADRVSTQTVMNRNSLSFLAPWLRRKVVVIRNGVNTERFSPTTNPIPGEPFRFISVGTAYRLKNPVGLTKAVSILRGRTSIPFVVEWIGSSGQGGVPSQDYHIAKEIIKRDGLERTMIFKGPSESIQNEYKKADALVHVSIQDGIPNAVVEAMASGLPIVVSRVSDLPLIVNEAENGFICNEKEPANIAEAMKRMLELNRTERVVMGKQSRELAIRWFDRERFVSEYETLYKQVLRTR